MKNIVKFLITLFPFVIFAQNDTINKSEIDTANVVNLKQITVVKKKKAVEHLADRTIFDFSEQSILNSGSLMEGLKKIPGIIASESIDVVYQGKTLEIYMDGRPLRVSGSNLISFLEGLPANSIDRIEIITNPGAEFAATSGNAILNIISSRKAPNHTTLTYSGGYSFSNYDKIRNKVNNSVFLTSRYKNINWKVNIGESYKESWRNNEMIDLLNLTNDRILRYNFLRPSLSYNFKNMKLVIDYDMSYSNSDDNVIMNNNNNNITENKLMRNELGVSLQRFFNGSLQKKLETNFVYTNTNNSFFQNNIQNQNTSKNEIFSLKIDYSTPLKFLDKTKVNIGGRYDLENIGIDSKSLSSFDFKRNTISSYAEFQTKYNSFDFIIGARGEKYYNQGTFSNNKISYDEFKLFPNASIKYNITNSIFLVTNYNKKIRLPSVNALNPNNFIFESKDLSYNGNPYLLPTFYDNFAVKFNAFDYATLSYDVSYIKDDILFLVSRQANKLNYKYQNVPNLTVHTFTAGLPLPLMVFTKGFDELMKFNFDINKLDILYFYTDYQKFKSAQIGDRKGIWSFFVSGQFILPKDINFQVIYKITSTGNYKYFLIDRPMQNSLNFNISRKFLDNRLSISIYGNDILNTNETFVRTIPLSDGITTLQKVDSRNFGISLNYKILNSKKNEEINNEQFENKEQYNPEIVPNL